MMIALGLLAAGCTPPPSASAVVTPVWEAPPAWPDPATTFDHPVLEVPSAFGRPGVFVSAGHGAPDNHGNLGSRCIYEEDFTLEAATHLADRLRAMGIFSVSTAREGDQRPSYPARLSKLARSEADVLIELHSDFRGHDYRVVGLSDDGEWCYQANDSPGLSILVSDEGSAELNADRLALARQVAIALAETGFLLYEGGYGDLYDDDEQAGVYLDRRGLMMLRRPTVPSLIIETHNALDRREAERWTEPRTRDAFSRAVTRGLLGYFSLSRSAEVSSPGEG